MRAAIFSVLIIAAAPAFPQVTPKAECAAKARQMQRAGILITELLDAFSGTYESLYAGDAQPELRSARDGAGQARLKVIDALADFQLAVEDLVYQLQLCAR